MKANKSLTIFFILLFSFLSSFTNAATQNPQPKAKISNSTQTLSSELENNESSLLEQSLLEAKQETSFLAKQLQQLQDQYLKQKSQLANTKVTNQMLNRAAVRVADTKILIENIKIALASARQEIVALQNSQKDLENKINTQNISSKPATNLSINDQNKTLSPLQDNLNALQKNLNSATQKLNVISQNFKMAQEILELNQTWEQALQEKIKNERLYSQLNAQNIVENQIQILQEKLQKRTNQLKTQLSNLGTNILQPSEEQTALKIEISANEENISLLDSELSLTRFKTKLNQMAESVSKQTDSLGDNEEIIEQLNRLQKELAGIYVIINNKTNLLKQTLQLASDSLNFKVISKANYQKQVNVINEALSIYAKQYETYLDFKKTLDQYQSKISTYYSKGLSVRQRLPTTLKDWRHIATQVAYIPTLFWNSIKNVGYQFSYFYKSADLSQLILLFITQFIWIGFAFFCYRFFSFLRRSYTPSTNSTFSSAAIFVLARIFQINFPLLFIYFNLKLLFWFIDLTPASTNAIMSLIFTILFFSVLISFAKIILLENALDVSLRDHRLYRGLSYALILGGFLTSLTVLAHQLAISEQTTLFLDRIFMLFLVAVSYPLFKWHDVLPSLLEKNVLRRNYVKRIFRLLSWLVPFAILSNATIGILGYTNLAWTIGIAEAQFLLIFSIWLLLRGLLKDLMDRTANYFIRHVSNGWLWAEALLKPLRRILHVLLFLGMVLTLFLIYGWTKNVAVLEWLGNIYHWKWFKIADVEIETRDLILFFAIFSVVLWAGKWSREFSYRWLYTKHRDLGIRNSLSVFTQYATFLVGTLVILKVLGISFTSITVALGAFAVAIGFGLKDIANNLLSGIILLIERPIRTGDMVTIDTYEGEVTKIGMRSMTLRTWDHMEVIVPNSIVVAQPFTNWTHRDTLVRTVINIPVSFDDEPKYVQGVIEQALERHPSVVSEPAPQVYLEKFADSCLIFEVRYFIDLRIDSSRPKVKSSVLFAIWDSLKAAGIELPYPHQDIEIKKSEPPHKITEHSIFTE